MQNEVYLKKGLQELNAFFENVSVIVGDKYFPIHGVRIENFPLGKNILEDTVNIVIPIPSCSGYFEDAHISGIHIDKALHTEFRGEVSKIPFCLQSTDTDLESMSEYYPLYSQPDRLPEKYLICLFSEDSPPSTSLEAVRFLQFYLDNFLLSCEAIAQKHLEQWKLDGNEESIRWLNHLGNGLSPKLKQHLLGEYYDSDMANIEHYR